MRELLYESDKWAQKEPIGAKGRGVSQTPTGKGPEIEEFLLHKQEKGGGETYVRSRMNATDAPLEEEYQSVKAEMSLKDPGFSNAYHHATGRSFRRAVIRRNHKERINRDRQVPSGDFEAREVTIGALHFVAIDYGDTIRASAGLKGNKNNDNREHNQCALLHLAAGVQGARAKRHQGIPGKQKVLLEVEECRRSEITQSNEALAWRKDRDGPTARELRSLAHDVVNAGRDRDYRVGSCISP